MTTHPAKFSASITNALANRVTYFDKLLIDPYAGVGGIFDVANRLVHRPAVLAVDIEPEFADAARGRMQDGDRVIVADSSTVDLDLDSFNLGTMQSIAVVTSPDYGNRFADQYLGTAEEQRVRAETGKAPRRYSYAVSLGRRVSEGSGAAHRFGDEYKHIHRSVCRNITYQVSDVRSTYAHTWVLNVSDHIRKKQQVFVTDWWVKTLGTLGWTPVMWDRIPTPRNRDGQNGELRCDTESVIVFRWKG